MIKFLNKISLSWLDKSKFSLGFCDNMTCIYFMLLQQNCDRTTRKVFILLVTTCVIYLTLFCWFFKLMWFLCSTVTSINHLITWFVKCDCIFLIPFQLLLIWKYFNVPIFQLSWYFDGRVVRITNVKFLAVQSQLTFTCSKSTI